MKHQIKKRVAIIPARGGSKRIPHKNIYLLEEHPMIAWTIKAAINSNCFDDIFVATDDQVIADISIKHGAQVPFLRTQEDADDHTPISLATVNFLNKLPNKYEEVVQLMANCPCRTAEDIQIALQNFENKKAHFQISVFKYGWMNPWWAMKMNEASSLPTPIFPEALKKRSQDLDTLYCPTGAIWVANYEKLIKHKTFYGPDHIICPMSWTSAVDIDEIEDLKMAEVVLKYQKRDSTTYKQGL